MTGLALLNVRSFHVRSVVDRVALGKFFSIRLFFLTNIISPMLPTHFDLHFAPTRRTNGGKPGNFKKIDVLFGNRGSLGRKVLALNYRIGK